MAAATLARVAKYAQQLIFLRRERERFRQRWEAGWADTNYCPAWLGRPISEEIVRSWESGWFSPSGAALDSGCGQGEVSWWFADRGYEVVGVDISEAAVRRARNLRLEPPSHLSFYRVDMTAEPPPDRQYAIVIDRGCFHQIPRVWRRRYVNHLALVTQRNAAMLIFVQSFSEKVDREAMARKRRKVARSFHGKFAIERVEATFMDRFSGTVAEHARPGFVFWMRKVG